MQSRSSQLNTQLIQLREESLKNFRLAGIGTLTSAILASQLGPGQLIDS